MHLLSMNYPLKSNDNNENKCINAILSGHLEFLLENVIIEVWLLVVMRWYDQIIFLQDLGNTIMMPKIYMMLIGPVQQSIGYVVFDRSHPISWC